MARFQLFLKCHHTHYILITLQKNHKYSEIVETLDKAIKEMDTMTYAQLNEILEDKLRMSIGHRGMVRSSDLISIFAGHVVSISSNS